MPHVLSPITPKYLKLLNPQRRNLYKRVGPKHTSTCLALHLKRTQESARSGHSELPNRFSPKRVGKRGHAAHKLRQMHSQPRLVRSRRRGFARWSSASVVVVPLRGPPSAACKSGQVAGQLCQCCFRSRQGRTRVDFVQLCLVLQWGSPDFQLRQLFPFLRRLASLRGTLERFIGRAWPQRNPLDALKTPASLGKQRYQPCEISIITARC